MKVGTLMKKRKLIVISALIIALIIGTGKEEYGNTYGNLRNKGIVAAKGNQIYYVAFDEGNVDKSEFDELFSDNFFPTIPNE